MGHFFERKSRVLPVQKRLQRVERLARRAARNPNPEVRAALVELAPVLRAWGRRVAANEIESASTGKPQSEARSDPVALQLLAAAGELRRLQDEIRGSFDRDSTD